MRIGVEASELAAMNRAERAFLGPQFTPSGGGSGQLLAGGTPVALPPGADVEAGFCSDALRLTAHLRPISADMPDGIGIFTDPARLRGLSRGLQIEATGWRAVGRLRVGLGLGLGAEWTRLHLSSAFIALTSRDFALVVPVTLRLQLPLRRGALELWLRKSFAPGGVQGTALGLGFTQRF